MVRQPLIRFRYAIKKAAEAGVQHVSNVAAEIKPQAKIQKAGQTKTIPAPPTVLRTSQRIEKPIPRAQLSDQEMDAIMLGGAL